MDAPTRIALEVAYAALLSAVVQLARVLGKPSPVQTRAERLSDRRSSISN